MTLRFGVFDHIEPVPGQRLDQIYRERLIQIERLDAAGFSLGGARGAENGCSVSRAFVPPMLWCRDPTTRSTTTGM